MMARFLHILVLYILFLKCTLCQMHNAYEMKDFKMLDNDTNVDVATDTTDIYDYDFEKINHKPVISESYTCYSTRSATCRTLEWQTVMNLLTKLEYLLNPVKDIVQ